MSSATFSRGSMYMYWPAHIIYIYPHDVGGVWF
jgi:hypothetical protein